ncbi:MAG: anti-sigma F factor [Lachnospiraceae bacterium]|nr:anti-sigma F factor [Lachnospiraceae bacterium]
MKIIFESCSENEAFARTVVAAYITRLNPTLEEMSDVKTAVSEAVTNCIIHGYENKEGSIVMECIIHNNNISIMIEDYGKGISDIEKAMEPLYTTRPEWERSGMGFAFMEAFMDKLEVESVPGKGTKVFMEKTIGLCEGVE